MVRFTASLACPVRANPRWCAAVSYTHLDVYKRQERECPSVHEGADVDGLVQILFLESHILRGDGESVSYTHLDVYKRQHVMVFNGRAPAGVRPLIPLPCKRVNDNLR